MQEANVYLYEFRHPDGTVTRSPEPGQQEIIDSPARYKVVVCGRRWGKDLWVGTPILTTDGWKTIGTVKVGDSVFGPDGLPTKVIDVTEFFNKEKSYQIVFSDGSEILSSPTHEWVVETKSYRKNISRTDNTSVTTQRLTTEEMFENYKFSRSDGTYESNYSIPVCDSLVIEEKPLLLPPYVLGYWLGDGTGRSGQITTDDKEVLDIIMSYGYFIGADKNSSTTYNIYYEDPVEKRNMRITDSLREIGVLNNKHIPNDYLLNSYENRLALLQGLMDSDGNVEESGRCEFTSTSERLANDVRILVSTLGIKSTINEYDAYLYGDYIGKKYRVKFTTSLPVFRIPRKLNRIKDIHKTDIRRRFIKSIKEIPAVTTRCISVDNSSHLFLVGETLIATHNSVLGINESLKKALAKNNSTVWYIAPTYGQAKTIAWRFLISRLQLFPKQIQERFRIQENQLQVTFPNGSVLALKGVDNPDSLRGSGLDYVVLDEYAMDNYQRYPVWREIIRPALADRGGGALFISTPKGFNGFYDLYAYADSGVDKDWKAWRKPTSSCLHISKKELESAKKELGDDLYEQEFEAEFKKRSGLVYKEFDREVHLIPSLDPMEVPESWTLEIGVDFGAGHPTAAVFVLFNPENDVAYVVDEFYQAEGVISENAAQMLALERRWLRKAFIRWGDCAGKQEIIEYNKNGFVLAPTPKGSGDSNTLSVDPGIQEIKARLRVDPVDKKPSIYIAKHCVNLIKEFENYKWKTSRKIGNTVEVDQTVLMENRMKDVPEKRWDDCLDALRYVVQYHRRHDADYTPIRKYKPRNALTGI